MKTPKRNHLSHFSSRIMIGAIRVYQKTLSPDHGFMRHFHRYGFCRHTPTCSEYAIVQFESRPFFVAFGASVRRILSCNPFAKTSDQKLKEVIARL